MKWITRNIKGIPSYTTGYSSMEEVLHRYDDIDTLLYMINCRIANKCAESIRKSCHDEHLTDKCFLCESPMTAFVNSLPMCQKHASEAMEKS